MNSHEDGTAAVATGTISCIGTDTFPQDEGNVALVVLPATMTSRYASDLVGNLQAMRGRPIALDASSVQQIGSLCLQVLISARNTWRADGQAFRVMCASEEMAKQWKLFGMAPGKTIECGG